MLAARLYGPQDMRVDEIDPPGEPGAGEVLVAVKSVGICGSDLHNYQDGRIGDTLIESPIILGHEFSAEVLAVGPDARDGNDEEMYVGQRVAVDPAQPCHRCDMCEAGHPNLCRRLHFCGLWPDDGALQERMIVQAHGCFPIPDSLSDVAGAMLEPLGVAIHAVDLGKLKVARSVAVLGSGPIGLLITHLARMSGADPVYAFDCHSWRAEKAVAWGASDAWTLDEMDPVKRIETMTNGKGVDVVFEAAWADKSVTQAAQMADLGGRLVLVGIASDDRLTMPHSAARRKGLTIMMARRMKHTYARAIHMAESGSVDLDDMVSHRYPLSESPAAFAKNFAYEPGVQKIVIEI